MDRRPDTPAHSGSARPDRRSLERLRARVERLLFTLECILATKRVSHVSTRSITSYDGSPVILLNSPSLLMVDHETKHIIRLLEKQRQIENSWTQRSNLQKEGKKSPSTVAPSTVGAIYRKIHHKFLARKTLKQTPHIQNRRTFIDLSEGETIEAENNGDEWASETCIEKAQRTLRTVGIKIAHTPLTWKERQFIENDALGRYGCFQLSFLRWSWTVIEECEG